MLRSAPHLLDGVELRAGWWQADSLMTPLTDSECCLQCAGALACFVDIGETAQAVQQQVG